MKIESEKPKCRSKLHDVESRLIQVVEWHWPIRENNSLNEEEIKKGKNYKKSFAK